MGKLKIISLIRHSTDEQLKETKVAEQLLKEAEQKGYATNFEGDKSAWCYDIPLKADITIYTFANANIIYINGKLAIKDIFSL